MAAHIGAPSPTGGLTTGLGDTAVCPTTGDPSTALGSEHSGSADSQSLLGSSPATSNLTEGDLRPSRPLVPGLYVPTVCFFDAETEDVDSAAVARHAVHLASAGVAGLATQGSNGEACHLTHAERQLVTSTTRGALDRAGFTHIPVIVGCAAQSTRETIEYCCEAWRAGGDYALVLPPSYYAPLFAPASRTIVEYYARVASASPIPVIIYNYPGGANGLDLSSDVIIELAKHPNIVGAKFTCGNTGKLNRVAAATRQQQQHHHHHQPHGGSGEGHHGGMPAAAHDAHDAHDNNNNNNDDYPSQRGRGGGAAAPAPPSFLVLAGSADFAVPSMLAGGHGLLAGLANLAPRACLRTLALCRAGDWNAARAAQEVVARGDWAAIVGGVVGVKAGMQAHLGYGGSARAPLPRLTDEAVRRAGEGFGELMELERTLW
ncbi:dihydrodipicolinate synthetase [Xylariaceae sp. FL0804]|nr:dihydrodipicolinate synthetase [Xylariaceae sp. FL0804]